MANGNGQGWWPRVLAKGAGQGCWQLRRRHCGTSAARSRPIRGNKPLTERCLDGPFARWKIACELPSHCGCDQREICFGHLDEAESECGAPIRFIADEREALEQWFDRRFVCGQIVDCAPEG